MHTCYVPADVFTAGTPRAWGEAALAALDAHGPLPGFDDPPLDAAVRAKLAREPIEDVRIDLEDGYGVRPDDEEDAAVAGQRDARCASWWPTARPRRSTGCG